MTFQESLIHRVFHDMMLDIIGHTAKKAVIQSSNCDTNIRHAAPFLSGIASHIERNSVPLEQVYMGTLVDTIGVGE